MTDDSVLHVLGQVPSGLFVLTVRHGEQETGLLVSWVMQAGFDPPMLSLALKRGRPACEWLEAGSPFALNLLAAGEKRHLRHFARGFETGQAAFDGLEIERTASGLAVLRDTVGYLECRPVRHVDSGDHRVFLAEIIGGGAASAEPREPVVHIRRSGMKY
jgi:flavin reductase (DIM6/NTAB) family NADH-FMN oxidoreductase RutF